MEWVVRLSGKDDAMQAFVRSFNDPELNIVFEHEYYLMKSTNFNVLSDHVEVLDLANQYVRWINGMSLMNLSLEGRIGEVYGVLKINDANQITHIYTQDEDHYDLRFGFRVRNDLNNEKHPHNNPANWANLAMKDKYVAKVFRFVDNGLDNVQNLYNIFEIIKNSIPKDSKGKADFSVLGVDFNDVGRLTGSLNNPDVMGDQARHPIENMKPMNKAPMSLEECKSFVQTMIYKWLHYMQQ